MTELQLATNTLLDDLDVNEHFTTQDDRPNSEIGSDYQTYTDTQAESEEASGKILWQSKISF